MQFIGIIPARYHSRRFPGKPLAMIRGKSMIQRVYEQSGKCSALNELVVATDDQRIYDHVSAFGKAVMTDRNHPSGTDRCLEAFYRINTDNTYSDNDGVINIQGDEPFVDPEQIDQVIHQLKKPNKNIVTLVKKIDREDDLRNPNVVKVVFTASGRALYFSRLPIPYVGGTGAMKETGEPATHYRHLGLYGFRAGTLQQIVSLPVGALEDAEKLEQLRWLQQDFEIYVEETYVESIAIDTPEDLEKVL